MGVAQDRKSENRDGGSIKFLLRTRHSDKFRVDKQEVSPACRMFGEREETIAHVVAECIQSSYTFIFHAFVR